MEITHDTRLNHLRIAAKPNETKFGNGDLRGRIDSKRFRSSTNLFLIYVIIIEISFNENFRKVVLSLNSFLAKALVT